MVKEIKKIKRKKWLISFINYQNNNYIFLYKKILTLY